LVRRERILMATIDSQALIDELIAVNGMYPGDEHNPSGPVVRIVQYTNGWGDRTHGVVYAREAEMGLLYRYETPTEFVRPPFEVVFSREP
jgi:hypothetical protein